MDPRSPYLSSPQQTGYGGHDVQLTDFSSHSLLRPAPAPTEYDQPAKKADSWVQDTGRPTIPGWPQQPRLLKRHPWLTALTVFGDVVLLLAWLALAAFGIGIARSIGVSKADLDVKSAQLAQGSIIAPTLFPIFFAATVGRCTRLIAMYRAESGELLGILDQLQGSTSFAGTLITAVTTRGGGLLSVLLLSLWSLSPLGGQSSLRAFYYQPNMTEVATVFPYLSMNNTGVVPAPSSTRIVFQARANALFSAALVSSPNVTNSPMDLWNNVKIPSIETLGRRMQPDSNGWFDTFTGIGVKDYSSLIGIPISMAAAQTGAARFSLETSYWALQCEPLISAQDGKSPNITLLSNATISPLPFNYTSTQSGINAFTDRSYDLYRNNRTNSNEARRILFVIEDHWKFFANCTISTTYVESEVHCRAGACGVGRIRRSVQPHASPNITGIDSEIPAPDRSPYLDNLLTAVPGRNSQPSTLSRYILGLLGVTETTEDNDRDKAALNNQPVFFDLLAQALNTYWVACIGYDRYVPDHNNANYTFGGKFEISETFEINFQNTTAAAVWTEEPVFAASTGWLVVFFVAVLIPLLAAVANLVLVGFVLRGPHLSMNFTTVVRDSPFVGRPPGGSTMGDYDRSYLMRDVKVRYGDVNSAEPVGYIALGSVDGNGTIGTGGVGRLDRTKTRYYE
ncbi:hypothetical protein QBC47DRAFT_416685 [Echria macrotheca]|uniref:Uncharacterized protein n=1 Tax=Echria macrotheca TaxID=438768 RepID=A0AAJ0B630_9PEZI|nr:hypothetical protein QBC47DRAFT_416685 [Echria macrotheca]